MRGTPLDSLFPALGMTESRERARLESSSFFPFPAIRRPGYRNVLQPLRRIRAPSPGHARQTVQGARLTVSKVSSNSVFPRDYLLELQLHKCRDTLRRTARRFIRFNHGSATHSIGTTPNEDLLRENIRRWLPPRSNVSIKSYLRQDTSPTESCTDNRNTGPWLQYPPRDLVCCG